MAYSYSRTVTTDYTKCGTANSTDFPVLVSGTYSYLATVANGGKVQNASGFDVAFYSDSGLTTQLKHEVEKYTATTGAVVYWVKVPTLSYAADTVIYMAYGDSGISTTQADPTNVWNSGFDAVYHGGDGTTLSLLDSTVNAFNGTNGGTAAVTGKVGGAINFVRSESDYVEMGTAGSAVLMINRPLSLSGWVYRSSTGTTQGIWGGGGAGNIDGYFLLRLEADKINLLRAKEANIASSTGTIAATTWTHFGVTYDASDNYVFYLNGAASGSGAAGSGFNASTNRLARLGEDGGGDRLDAYLDEIRKSNVIRSASWILAEYNNQNSPSTFYSVGSEVGGGAAAVPRLAPPQTIAVMRASSY